jgi:hypothetical protein
MTLVFRDLRFKCNSGLVAQWAVTAGQAALDASRPSLWAINCVKWIILMVSS